MQIDKRTADAGPLDESSNTQAISAQGFLLAVAVILLLALAQLLSRHLDLVVQHREALMNSELSCVAPPLPKYVVGWVEERDGQLVSYCRVFDNAGRYPARRAQ